MSGPWSVKRELVSRALRTMGVPYVCSSRKGAKASGAKETFLTPGGQ